MKSVTSAFKSQISKMGKEIDVKITFDQTELTNRDINIVNLSYDGAILKSVMKKLEIDSNVDIPIGTWINFQFGLKVGNSYEYIDYGNFKVINSEKQEDTNSYKLTCYDKVIEFMKDYNQSTLTFPMTIREFLSSICQELNVEYKSSDFANYDKTLTYNPFLDSEGNDLGYTYRDILDQLSEVSGGTICVNDEDKIEVRYINDGEQLDYQLYGETTQNGTPTPDEPIPVINKTGLTTVEINGTNYSVDLGNTELCKIGTYQDYIYKSNNIWYLHKEIGKVVLDGSESWILDTTKTITQVFKKTGALIDKKTDNKNFLSNYFINQAGDTEKISFDINNLYIAVNKTTASTVIEFKTWLSAHNTIVYYVLATPTTTEITDTNLIYQLNHIANAINERNLKDINVNFGEIYGPINSVVLSRAGESDNIYLRDETSVTTNGLCEIKIVDNQIMNDNNRSDYLQDILDKVNGITYSINDFKSTGICYLELCDRYNVIVGESTYPCIMFNDEIIIESGLEENINTERPEQSETDYTKADKTDRRINQAYSIVDKQNLTITNLVSQTTQSQQLNDQRILELQERTNSVVQTLTTTNATIEVMQRDILEGQETLRNNLVNIDINGINVSTNSSAIQTLMTNEKFVIKSGNQTLAFFGYDTDTNSTKAEMDNLTVTNYFIAGVHRVETIRISGEERTGWFYIG